VPEEVKRAAVAETIEDLPALTVQLVGQVTASNLDAFETVVLSRIKAINTTLVTDSDFATADKMVKFLDDGEKRLDLVKSQALSQTASIDQLFRTIDGLKAEMKSKRLTLDKLVKAEKENRKAEIVTKAMEEFRGHLDALQKRVSVGFTFAGPALGESIKGLKSLDSMRDKVSVALANAKIEANSIADRIAANKQQLIETDAMILFPDFATVCTKAPEDFDALISMRVNQRKEAESKRLEAEREKIRAEEKAKAEAAAAAKVAEEARIAKAEADAKAATEKAEADRLATEEIRKIDEQRKAQAMEREKIRAEEKAKAAMPDEAQKQTVEDHIEQPLALVDQLPDATKMIDDRSGPRITSLRIQISEELGKMNVFELGNVLAYCQALPLKNKLAA
jgi:DNA repair exonuclease SbcCD ATPase subunit